MITVRCLSSETSAPSQSGECAAYIGIGGMKIENEPREKKGMKFGTVPD